MTILHELHTQRPDLLSRPDFHVFIDGGVRRGTDVLKALCLGARGVGLGRPFLYANSAWGEDGVRRVIDSTCFYSTLIGSAEVVPQSCEKRSLPECASSE